MEKCKYYLMLYDRQYSSTNWQIKKRREVLSRHRMVNEFYGEIFHGKRAHSLAIFY